MKKLIFFIIMFCLVLNLSLFTGCNSQKQDRQAVDMNPTFVLNVDIDEKNISVEANLLYTSVIESDKIVLQYYPLCYEPESKTPLSLSNATESPTTVIDELKVNGENANYTMDYSVSSINIEYSVCVGDQTTIEMKYRLTLPQVAHRLGYIDDYYSLCRFYPYVAPVIDGEYSARSYSEIGETELFYTADFDVAVNLSDKYVLAHTGTAYQTSKTEKTVNYRIKAEKVRDFALAYSKNFTRRSVDYNQTTVNYYFLKDATPNFELEVTRKALEVFGRLFGEYQRQQLSLIVAPFPYGGMEYSELIVVSSSLKDDSREETIAHEVAHQWWFLKVGNDQAYSPWIDESLAEFSTALYYLQTDRGQVFESYRKYGMQTMQNRIIDRKNTAIRGSVYDYNRESYSDCVYTLGCLMWINLYSIEGRDLIDDLANYAETNSTKIATENDVSELLFSERKSLLSAWLDGKVIT